MKGTIFGSILGGIVGRLVGGIGVAVLGTAFGIPATVVTITTALIGADIGDKVQKELSK